MDNKLIAMYVYERTENRAIQQEDGFIMGVNQLSPLYIKTILKLKNKRIESYKL